MSRNSSINGNKHPYQRKEAWTDGIKKDPPLLDNFKGKSKDKMIRLIEEWTKKIEYIKRSDNFREVNGYPKK